MPDQLHRTYHDEEIINVETRHEESDVNVRALLWFVVIFIAFAVVTHFALYGMFRFLVNLERGNANAPLTSMDRPPDMDVPQTPRLQPFPAKSGSEVVPPYGSTPVIDMVEMRAHEQEVLDHYGWVDRQKGIVHIPIGEAKKQWLASQPMEQRLQPVAPVPIPAKAGAPSSTQTQ
jgi:hypothetical protein